METFMALFESMPFWQKAAWLSFVLLLCWVLEMAVPLARLGYRKWRHVLFNFTFLGMSSAINLVLHPAMVAIALWAGNAQWGLLHRVGWPWWVELLLALALFDFVAQYVAHVLLHQVPVLFRFHSVHHSDTTVDATTATRHHPIDYVVRESLSAVVLFVTGAPVAYYVVYRLVTIFFGYTSHANFRYPRWVDRTLGWILITPNMHKFHHHHELPWTDTNYGNVFSFWDRLFGTLVVDDPRKVRYGLDVMDAARDSDFWYQMGTPFRSDFKQPGAAGAGAAKAESKPDRDGARGAAPGRPTMPLALLVAALAGGGAACGDGDSTAARLAPVDPGDQAQWRVADPAAVGLDATQLEAARDYVFQDDFHTQAVVIVRHGYLAAEWYADGTDMDTLATSWSVGKSFTATLIGQAIADGEIAGVDVPMSTFLPAWEGTDKAPITLKDVLAMSSGLGWVEDYTQIGSGEGTSDIAEMVVVADPLGVAFEQPVRDPAGEVWTYSSGDTMLLGHALRQATGKTAADLVQTELADPLGMRELHWWRDASDTTYTFCCIDATPRDFAKFGQLYLQDGVWGGEQLVPADWIAAATRPQAEANPGYGYQWWLNHPEAEGGTWPSLPANTALALGKDGQYVVVIPELDMVVVRLGHYVVPETDDWVASDGLFGAGVVSDNFGATGSRPPEGDWDDDRFFGLIVDAVVE